MHHQRKSERLQRRQSNSSSISEREREEEREREVGWCRCDQRPHDCVSRLRSITHPVCASLSLSLSRSFVPSLAFILLRLSFIFLLQRRSISLLSSFEQQERETLVMKEERERERERKRKRERSEEIIRLEKRGIYFPICFPASLSCC